MNIVVVPYKIIMKLSTEGTSPTSRHITTQAASVSTDIATATSQTKGTTPPTNIMKHLRRAAGSKKPGKSISVYCYVYEISVMWQCLPLLIAFANHIY